MDRVAWECAIVASLAESKRAGYTFDVAWSLALRANPAHKHTPKLEGPKDRAEASVADVTREMCRDAWFGERPALKAFSLEMLRESDRTSEARSSGSFRVDSLVTA